MQKITPFLWFNGRVKEAMHFYTSVFKNAEIKSIHNGPDGEAFTATIVLEGQEFMALNGGPQFAFTEAVSFFVKCKDQQEIDYYWNALTADGGQASRCGWLKDKYGLSWQIVPEQLDTLLYHSNRGKGQKVMEALMKMDKLILADLEKAAM